MANTVFMQQALANDPTFRQRLKAQMTAQAFVVLAEAGSTTNHGIRKTYALQFLSNPDGIVANLAGVFVFRTNVMAGDSTVAFDGRGGTVVQNPVTDAALFSQISADWDQLAGA